MIGIAFLLGEVPNRCRNWSDGVRGSLARLVRIYAMTSAPDRFITFNN
jgi:hypothetical protein